MGFLSPLLLLLGAAAAVPLILHLLRRDRDRRVSFPALRYLQRTTRERARQIRLRQLLLLALRIAAVAVISLAAARLVVPLPGGEHEPTAVVVILDNSLSSGLVEDGRRALDDLKDAGLAGLEHATDRDRIWVLRAGEPWELVVPLPPEEARERIRRTEVSHAAGALDFTVRRAREILAGAHEPARELHIHSDLQRSGLEEGSAGEHPANSRILASSPPTGERHNRWLSDLRVGEGAPPVVGERTRMVATARARPEGDEVGGIPVRLVVEDEIVGVAETGPDGTVSFTAGPFPVGWVEGRLEMDPDALAADAALHFAFRVREPPRVRTGGQDMGFVEEALGVLEESDRIRREAGPDVDLVIQSGAETDGLDLTEEVALVLVPPASPADLPAFNRFLAAAGSSIELSPEGTQGQWTVTESRIPVALEGITVGFRYRIEDADRDPEVEVLADLSDGSPWIASDEGHSGRVLVLASPLIPEASELPVRAPLIPFLEWVLGDWIGGGSPTALTAGDTLRAPEGATTLRTPDGRSRDLDDTSYFPETRTAGIHRIFRGDSLVEMVAVNPPASESDLTPAARGEVESWLGTEVEFVDSQDGWTRTAFRPAGGREPWRFLVAAAFILLLVESLVAAGGGDRRGERGGTGENENPSRPGG